MHLILKLLGPHHDVHRSTTPGPSGAFEPLQGSPNTQLG